MVLLNLLAGIIINSEVSVHDVLHSDILGALVTKNTLGQVHVRQIFSMSDEISGSSDILPEYHVILIVSLALSPCN